MKSTDECLELLKHFKETNADKYGIRRLGVFGSVARGEQREDSDVDVCLEIDTPSFSCEATATTLEATSD